MREVWVSIVIGILLFLVFGSGCLSDWNSVESKDKYLNGFRVVEIKNYSNGEVLMVIDTNYQDMSSISRAYDYILSYATNKSCKVVSIDSGIYTQDGVYAILDCS